MKTLRKSNVLAAGLASAVVAGMSVIPFGSAFAYSLDFVLVNNIDQPIVALWASNRVDSSWESPFAHVFVESGGRQNVHFSEGARGDDCYYDIRVKFRNGAVRVIDNVDLCKIRVITLDVNDGGKVVYSAR